MESPLIVVLSVLLTAAVAAAVLFWLRGRDARGRVQDLESLKAASLEAARAAVLTAAQDVSSKLLEDHKRESDAAHQRAEARLKEVAAPLVEQVDKIKDAVAALNSQVEGNRRAVDAMQRALSSPAGAGAIAEVGLGNTLRAFGLEEGHDFQLQFTTTGDGREQLRPDAVVFVPPDTIMVIDCKASKYLFAIAEAEDKAAEAAAYEDLAATMNRHLRALAGKDYQGAVQASWRASGRGAEAARVFNIMYLPSDVAIGKIVAADPTFRKKARDLGIALAGPDALHFAISVVAVEIRGQRQAQNQQQIIEAAGRVLDSLRVVLDAAAKAGRGIETAANSFADLAKSVNGRLLSRVQRLAQAGVVAQKPLPKLPAIA